MATPVGGILCFGAGCRATPCANTRPHSASRFLMSWKKRIRVVIETGGMGVAGSTNLINDWIGHGVASNSSSGVNMIGALNPFPLQTFSITGLIIALAKYRQFHVSRLTLPQNAVVGAT